MEEGRQVGDGGSGSGRAKSSWQIAVERRMSSISQAAKVQELACKFTPGSRCYHGTGNLQDSVGGRS